MKLTYIFLIIGAMSQWLMTLAKVIAGNVKSVVQMKWELFFFLVVI